MGFIKLNKLVLACNNSFSINCLNSKDTLSATEGIKIFRQIDALHISNNFLFSSLELAATITMLNKEALHN